MKSIVIFFLAALYTFQIAAQSDPLQSAAQAIEAGDANKALSIYEDIYKNNVESYSHDQVLEAIDKAQNLMMQQGRYAEILPIWDQGVKLAEQWMAWDKYFSYQSAIYQMRIAPLAGNQGINFLKQMLDHPHQIKAHRVRFLKGLGDEYNRVGKEDSAMIVLQESFQGAQEIGDSMVICTSLGTMAGIERKRGNSMKAIELSKKAIEVSLASLPYVSGGLYKQLADLFYDINDDEKAFDYAERCVESGIAHGYEQWEGHGKAIQGQIRKRQKNYAEAIPYFESAIEKFRGKTSNNATFPVCVDLTKCYFETGKIKKGNDLLVTLDSLHQVRRHDKYTIPYLILKAERHLENNALAEANRELLAIKNIPDQASNLKQKNEAVRLNAIYQEKSGKPKAAISLLNQYYQKRESIKMASDADLVQELEARYQKAEQDKAIADLELSNQISTAKIENQRRTLLFGGIALLILGGLLAWVYQLYQTNKKNKEQLAENNKVIENALAEKNVLLQEIHHRVKNNLQVISSLLSLQSRFIKDDAAIEAINASKGRVQSMSLLHQNLYRDDNLKGVEMRIYFENLVENLFHTYRIEDRVQFESNIEDLNLDIDTVVPLGLITNELITNALKHAYTDMEDGLLTLNLHQDADQLVLEVTDNGKGLKENKLPLKKGSLGAKLVHSFAEKLEAKLEVDGSQGTSIKLLINNFQLA